MAQPHLPVELIVRILSFLPFKDLVICSGVSHQFRRIIDTSSILEYILELGLCGLVDSTQGKFTTSERLFRLRQREAAWSALDWHAERRIPVNQKYIFWELIGGLFAGTYMKTPIRNPSFYTHRAFDTIDIFTLGSGAEAGPRHMALEQMFYDFAIDPGQDLLILLELPPFIQCVFSINLITAYLRQTIALLGNFTYTASPTDSFIPWPLNPSSRYPLRIKTGRIMGDVWNLQKFRFLDA